MAQISRPFQIVLVAFVLFAVAWFAVIHRPGGESSTGGSASSASSAASATHAGAAHTGAAHAGAATHAAAHASVPARDHARVATPARHARAATPAHAKTVAPAHARTAAPATAAHGRAAAHPSHARGTAHAASHTASSASATAALTLHNLTSALHLSALVKLLDIFDPTASAKVAHAEGVEIARIKAALQPSSQASIAAELKHGKTVLLLFLNPHSYDDDASAIAAVEVAYKLRHDVDAHLALASQVNSYGSITRDIPIYQTPTLLIVNPKRQVTPLTGLTDEFALEQAISEAKAAA
ncbi:MAG TPA: hypothetical protein VNV37_11860 [Solirubrobacteraceae bacterium]|nr:hypothetical protein [Solirubrobacteraceae bacterium]